MQIDLLDRRLLSKMLAIDKMTKTAAWRNGACMETFGVRIQDFEAIRERGWYSRRDLDDDGESRNYTLTRLGERELKGFARSTGQRL